jgi:hypothetical protein
MFKLQIASQHVLLLITHEIAQAKTKQFKEMFFAKKTGITEPDITVVLTG